MAISNIEPSWTLGDRLAKARREAGLQAQRMADLFGVSRNTISAWEHDTVEIKASVVRRWAEVTGVSVAWLLSDERSQDGDGRGPHRAPAAGAAALPVPIRTEETEEEGDAEVHPSAKSGPSLFVTSSSRRGRIVRLLSGSNRRSGGDRAADRKAA